MGNVGLLLVGVVLLVNGLSSLGVVPLRSVAPLNLFVGGVQVVLPTLILAGSAGDPAVVSATWPTYLFGFTYLWFGLIAGSGQDAQGFGWFSAFVSAIAAYQAVVTVAVDPAFAVVWATWSVMWGLFFVLLGLGRSTVNGFALDRFTGWFLVLLGVPTCTVTALLIMGGGWSTDASAGVVALGVLAGATVLAVALTRSGAPRPVAGHAASEAGPDAHRTSGTHSGAAVDTSPASAPEPVAAPA